MINVYKRKKDMKFLIIDGDEKNHEVIKKFIYYKYKYEDNVTSIYNKKFELNEEYDIIFLDHDLGGKQSIIKILDRILNHCKKDTYFIIHSMNVVRARSISSTLFAKGFDKNVIIPFYKIKEVLD